MRIVTFILATLFISLPILPMELALALANGTNGTEWDQSSTVIPTDEHEVSVPTHQIIGTGIIWSSLCLAGGYLWCKSRKAPKSVHIQDRINMLADAEEGLVRELDKVRTKKAALESSRGAAQQQEGLQAAAAQQLKQRQEERQRAQQKRKKRRKDEPLLEGPFDVDDGDGGSPPSPVRLDDLHQNSPSRSPLSGGAASAQDYAALQPVAPDEDDR